MSCDKTYKLTITDKAKTLPDAMWDRLFDLTYNGIEIEPDCETDCIPMPWDAMFSIERAGDQVNIVIVGGVGSRDYGYCEVRVPITQDCYKFSMMMRETAELSAGETFEEACEKLIEDLTKLGYIVTEEV